MEKVVKAMIPFYIMMVVALLLITYIPDLSLCIPKAFGYVQQGAGILAMT